MIECKSLDFNVAAIVPYEPLRFRMIQSIDANRNIEKYTFIPIKPERQQLARSLEKASYLTHDFRTSDQSTRVIMQKVTSFTM